MDAIREEEKPRGPLERLPIVGEYFAMARLARLENSIRAAVALRAVPEQKSLPPAQLAILARFVSFATKSVGWAKPNFRLDDEVGPLLWSPTDCLAGVQTLMELEEVAKLPPGTLKWEDWERQPLSNLMKFLAGDASDDGGRG